MEDEENKLNKLVFYMLSDTKSFIKDFKFRIQLYESCNPNRRLGTRKTTMGEESGNSKKLIWELYKNPIESEEIVEVKEW